MTDRSFTRETYLRLIEITGSRHDEATKCAEAEAWLAATVMLGAALEGVLLVTAANEEPDLRARGLWPPGDPLRWDLHGLVQLGLAAGWFEAEDFNTPEVNLGEVVDSVRELRNALHPGRYAREFGPQDEIGEDLCRALFTVLEAVFEVSNRIVGDYEE